MRAKVGSQFVFVVLATLLVQTSESRADFAQCPNPLPACTATSSGCCAMTPTASYNGAKPIIITMDRCHQTPDGHGAPTVGAPRRELTITSITRTTTTVTVTTSTDHGMSSNEYAKIAGTGVSDLNGTFQVKTGNGCTPNCTTTTFQYSTSSSGAASATTGKVLAHNIGAGWCGDAVGSDATRIGGDNSDEGMFQVYGLVYRLMQRNIPVYWLVNPSKSPVAIAGNVDTYLASDVDVWVTTSDVTAPPSSGASLTDCLTGAGCTQPVHRLNAANLNAYNDSYRYKQFPVRGGAFMIAAENRAAFDKFWKREAPYDTLDATKYNWIAGDIDLYEVDASAKFMYQNFESGDGTSTSPFATINGAPLAVKIDYEPPRIACLGCNNNVVQAWLAEAKLQDPATAGSCATGEFIPSDAVYCVLNDYDVAQGTLVAGGFSWVWMFGYNDNSPCGNSAEKAIFDKIRDFMTTVPAIRNAGHGVFLDDSVKVAEGCPNKQLMGKLGTADGLALATSGAAEPYIIRYPTNLLSQTGDLGPSIASGAIAGWRYYNSAGTAGYQGTLPNSGSSLRRLMTVDESAAGNDFCIQHKSSVLCDKFTTSASTGDLMDVAAYARFGDNLNNGLAYYLPGNQMGNNGNAAELRMLLNSLLALPDETFTTSPTDTEVARSSPIVATIDTSDIRVFQGTYVHQNPVPSIPKATTSSGVNRFTFPYITGHMRAIDVASFTACSGAGCTTSNTSRTAISALSGVLFDAANGIPTAVPAGCSAKFNGSCRSVFTTLASGRLPAEVDFSTAQLDSNGGSSTTLGATIAGNLTQTERELFVSRVLAGKQDSTGAWVSKLGGVDRSTPAVIGPSPLAGSLGRPTMVYFGATDGMLHAVCVTTGGGCDVVGRELWAYIPRTVLPDLRQSTARVDGSPHVIDAYGDFDNNGTDAWHTILVFHTGTGRMTANNVVPAVYAIDITTPNAPNVLWEYSVTNVGARQAYDMGVGLNIVSGTVQFAPTDNRVVAFMQTNNGGTGGAASVITAINIEDGTEIWQFGDLYPTNSGKSARSSAHEAAPSSGIPGGAVGLDTTGTSKINKVVYGTLYGDVFVRAASDGAPQNGESSPGVANPLLRVSVDYKPIGVPPAIYSKGGVQYAAFGTGGYVDSQASLWRGTNESTVPTQMVFAVSTAYTGATIDETNTTNVPVKFDLGAGEGVFAQITVVGTQLFASSDTTNVNDYAFGTSSTPTGRVNSWDFGATTPPSAPTTMVVASGAGSIFNSGTTLINASGKYGERLTNDAITTVGTAVDPMSTTNKIRRALWLRTE
jgi:hypothetical protein